MFDLIFDLRSAIGGLLAMRWPYPAEEGKPKWALAWRIPPKHCARFRVHLWTPGWHKGRGPYLSIGLWALQIYRGY